MKLTNADLKYCSRDFLEAAEDSIADQVAAGREDLRPWLAAIRAAIPDAPTYALEHRTRDGIWK